MINKKQAIENRATAPVYVGVDEIMGMFSICRQTALKIGEESGATVKIGRSRRYNVEKIKAYIEKHTV